MLVKQQRASSLPSKLLLILYIVLAKVLISLALPVMLVFYIIGVIWKRTRPARASEIDLVTGRKCFAVSLESL